MIGTATRQTVARPDCRCRDYARVEAFVQKVAEGIEYWQDRHSASRHYATVE